jgi:hypothetical protein
LASPNGWLHFFDGKRAGMIAVVTKETAGMLALEIFLQ